VNSLSPSSARGSGLRRPQAPLIVVIRWTAPARLLDRYRPQLKGGFATLLKTGASFTDAYQDHAVTETAPGHSTICRGAGRAHRHHPHLAGVQDQARR